MQAPGTQSSSIPEPGDRRRGGRPRRQGGTTSSFTPRAPRSIAATPPPTIVASPEPPEVVPIRELLSEILTRMGVGPCEILYHVRPEGEYLEVRGRDLATLIGRHGNTLEALNLVFNTMLHAAHRSNGGSRQYYTIDAEGYRARRADALKSLALQALERAVRERKPQMLEPMLPSERKIIHLALSESPFVSTASAGVEPERRVVVTPK